MKATSTSPKAKDKLLRLGAVLFWLLIWQLGSMAVDQEILLVSPVSACATLIRLMGESSFYQAVFGSFGRILAGFALSTVLGILLAALSCAFSPVRVLLRPLLSTIKATPVASIVILALIWIRSTNLSIFISFLMAVSYTHLYYLRAILQRWRRDGILTAAKLAADKGRHEQRSTPAWWQKNPALDYEQRKYSPEFYESLFTPLPTE